ncbi:MAG: hypothetical protein SAK29_21610 [Scytonema sp. PMC 1069.18]|nr:hypothetical protein [Scytonema sp. PMC 1069.18]MEC4884460.1 hypothetical protein [Scytonema sp. PMC 1070.18]
MTSVTGAIARALVHRPQLLLADEPTSALDWQTGKEIIKLMTTLAKEQRSTVLIVTHDSRIFSASDRIVCMDAKRG